jgi:moderate conductance mechanosensitive channel
MSARGLARLAGCVLLLFVLGLAAPARAAAPAPAPQDQPTKVRQLLDLLSDPEVQSWIQAQQAGKAAALPAAEGAAMGYMSARVGAIRAHLVAVVAVIPRLPEEFGKAAHNFGADLAGRSFPGVLALVVVFLALGFGVERLWHSATQRIRLWSVGLPMATVGQRLGALLARLVYEISVVLVFGAASIGVFLIFDWPTFLREMLLGYLFAFLALRLALVASRSLLAPASADAADPDRFRVLPMADAAARFWHGRLVLLIGWFAFGWATVSLLGDLGFAVDARRLVAYVLGLGLLAIGFDMVWRHPIEQAPSAPHRRALAWLVSAYFILLWLLWVASALPLMWLLVVIVFVPWAIGGAQRAIANLVQPPGGGAAAGVPSILAVSLQRGLRAALIIAGALFLADKWHIGVGDMMATDTVGTRLLRGLLSTVVIALLADFGWHVLRAAIDRKISEVPDSADHNSEEWRRHARLKTLLPILRNVLFVVLLVMVGLMALAALGVEIGPLVAGAGVVGVAVGFGAQTLVHDIISGMFYLLDDAFRVGEYVQSGNYKGTVESFSLRSVKLRHHRGPLFTVPFGQLGAIQNMSRDWVIEKMSIGVTYDTDLAKVKKIIKQIGKELMEDPELGPKFLEPLKMQGVEQFGDFAIQIRIKMMTRPNEQFVIRRRAYAMIKQAFDANGIEFAFPTVQVAGGTDAGVAASAHQVLARPAAEE